MRNQNATPDPAAMGVIGADNQQSRTDGGLCRPHRQDRPYPAVTEFPSRRHVPGIK